MLHFGALLIGIVFLMNIVFVPKTPINLGGHIGAMPRRYA